MSFSQKRREFFSAARNLLAVGGIAGQFDLLKASPAAGHAPTAAAEDYYEKLGVTKMINAAGVYTSFTASTMPPSVQAAVALAAKHPVHLMELQKAAGEYIARKLRCEAALVSAGASSALTLGTAACVLVANKCGIRDIPTQVPHLKNEVIIQKAHRYGYDQGLLCCGIRFVEVETMADYRAAFNEKTILAHFFNAAENGQISREDWIRVAREHRVPTFNDAAADVPPISNLWNYTQMGFDLVTFSGGKGMRGPQNSGLLLGKKELIEAAAKNNNPFEGVGRGQKVAKEQIVGMVAAVDWFLSQTDEGMETEFRRRADRIASQLHAIPTVECSVVVPPVANHVPHLLVRYDETRLKISVLQVAEELRKGTPCIELNPSTGQTSGAPGLPVDGKTIIVGVWMMEPGEDAIVGRRLQEVLSKAARA
jgi:L-seryl-tRNA(Ser) seleniumtransferase